MLSIFATEFFPKLPLTYARNLSLCVCVDLVQLGHSIRVWVFTCRPLVDERLTTQAEHPPLMSHGHTASVAPLMSLSNPVLGATSGPTSLERATTRGPFSNCSLWFQGRPGWWLHRGRGPVQRFPLGSLIRFVCLSLPTMQADMPCVCRAFRRVIWLLL